MSFRGPRACRAPACLPPADAAACTAGARGSGPAAILPTTVAEAAIMAIVEGMPAKAAALGVIRLALGQPPPMQAGRRSEPLHGKGRGVHGSQSRGKAHSRTGRGRGGGRGHAAACGASVLLPPEPCVEGRSVGIRAPRGGVPCGGRPAETRGRAGRRAGAGLSWAGPPLGEGDRTCDRDWPGAGLVAAAFSSRRLLGRLAWPVPPILALLCDRHLKYARIAPAGNPQ